VRTKLQTAVRLRLRIVNCQRKEMTSLPVGARCILVTLLWQIRGQMQWELSPGWYLNSRSPGLGLTATERLQTEPLWMGRSTAT